MLQETNRTIYLKITLTEKETIAVRHLSDEDVLIHMGDDPISDFTYQVLYNVEHES